MQKTFYNFMGSEEGEQEIYYKNGAIKEKKCYFDGVLEWIKKYYKTGILQEEQYYCFGAKCETWKKFYPSGALKETSEYDENRLNGLTISYTRYGRIISRTNYIDDEPIQLTVHYDNRQKKSLLQENC
jgi:antitoxin component YwqK of YwqJK toxin-antitoxin module